MGVSIVVFQIDGGSEGLGGGLEVAFGVVDAAEVKAEAGISWLESDGLVETGDGPLVGALGEVDEIAIDEREVFPVGDTAGLLGGGEAALAERLLDEGDDRLFLFFREVGLAGEGIGQGEVGLRIGQTVEGVEGI